MPMALPKHGRHRVAASQGVAVHDHSTTVRQAMPDTVTIATKTRALTSPQPYPVATSDPKKDDRSH